jgi:hypothetical protein
MKHGVTLFAAWLSRRSAMARAAVMLLGANACRDSTSAPPTLGARYELTSYDSKLPYPWRAIVTADASFRCDDKIVGGSLLFASGTSVTEIIEDQLFCSDGTISPLSADTATGQYTRSGNSLSLHLQGTLRLQAASPYDQTAELAGSQVRILTTVSRTPGGTQISPIVQVFTLVQ